MTNKFCIWCLFALSTQFVVGQKKGILSGVFGGAKPESAEDIPGGPWIGPNEIDDGCPRKYLLSSDEKQRTPLAFKRYGIVPNLVPVAPPSYLQVTFDGLSDCQPNLGNVVDICGLTNPPKYKWNCNAGKKYTIFFVDDYPLGIKNPGLLQVGFLQWIVDIPGCNVAAGKTIVEYQQPLPLYGSGENQYSWGVFEQPPYDIDWSEEYLVSSTSEKHRYYMCPSVILKYDLTAVAGNFFHSVFQPCVEEGLDKLDEPSPQYVTKSEERANLPADPYASDRK